MSDNEATPDPVKVTEDSRWILWDPRDGEPRLDADYDPPRFISDGLVGRLGRDNVYLTTYANYIDGFGIAGGQGSAWGGVIPARRHTDLAVGMRCLAEFNLSGSKGTYEVIRVA